MRTLSILAAVASLSITGSAFAQSMNGDYSASNRTDMYGNTAYRNHAVMHRGYGQRQHAFGSTRHPTVGNTANQRVNGG